ncbi:DUF3352 domain-containing protein [Solicola gregarius]|uniref:DUF3352 domain-containing protein n=1 Tax=Solicola gregarius TaxID=2908642 RepID=A0AA46THD0_9ACTN|nr:DUF3352 domain-containing protein [Solicola gregarius]UYM05341.1 DUF3352 domain-containing protein [Solicola gregarius]
MTIGIAAVVAVGLVVAGGVFAWSKLSGGGPQPAEAVPSDAMAYVRLDLDPSASQKLDAMSLLHKWPEFEDATGISDDDVDLRKLFVDEVLAADCDVDFADDIEPWIGDRLGFAIVGGADSPAPMLAVQVSDEDKAEDGANKLADCTGGLGMPGPATASSTASAMDDVAYAEDEESNLGVAFSGDYMIVAPTQDLADDFAKDAESDSLAANDAFRDDMDSLGDEGIASMWFDGDAFVDAAEQMGMSADDLEALGDQDLGSGAAALRAGDDYLELVTASDSPTGAGGAKADVGGLSDSTMFAASISDGKKVVDDFWTQFESGLGDAAPELDLMLDDVEQNTGLTLPDDLATLLGDQFLVAVDSEGLDPEMDPGSLEDINAGMRFTSDPGELSGVVDKVENTLVGMGGPSLSEALVKEETDDGMVLATNDDYASMLTDGGGDLGDSDVYQKAVPAGDDAVNVVYANLDEITELAPDSDEDVQMLEPLQAFGFASQEKDDRTVTTMRLTFD